MKHTILHIIMVSVVSFFCPAIGMAQSEALDAAVHVIFETAGEKEYRTVQYAVFKTEHKANVVMDALQEAIVLQRGDKGAVVLTAWDEACTKQKVKFRQSSGKGEFKVHAYPDMAILVCSYLPDDELTIEDARMAVIPLKAGQTEYEHIFKTKISTRFSTISRCRK